MLLRKSKRWTPITLEDLDKVLTADEERREECDTDEEVSRSLRELIEALPGEFACF